MTTEFLTITGTPADDEIIGRAAVVIKSGGLVAIPTETVYGLAGSALLEDSARKIYAAKGRPADNPLIVHLAKPEDAELYGETTPLYYRLAERFMPGPLTIILKKKDNIPDTVTAGGATAAFRCPSHPIAHRLIEVSGHPIAAPSANSSGFPSPTNALHVKADMDGKIDMILDGGECEIGVESPVVKLNADGCTILRPGAVTEDMLADVCGKVTISPAVIEPTLVDEKNPESPGMKYKHYSPTAEVILFDAPLDVFAGHVNGHGEGKYGVFTPADEAHLYTVGILLITGETDNASQLSHSLFTLLRNADELGLDTVYVRCPPKSGEYLAVYNRIVRAAGCRITKLRDSRENT